MIVDDNSPNPPEKLPCRTFRYAARSGTSHLCGTVHLERRATLDQLNQHMFEILAMRAGACDIPWNCFNVSLLLKASV